MSYKLSVKDLKRPDKFLKVLRSFINLISLNIKTLFIFSGLIVVFVALIVFYNYIKDKKEQTASFKLYQTMKEFKDDTTNEDKIIKLQNLILNLPNTKTKYIAKFNLAKLFFEEKNYEEAINYFNKVSRKNIEFVSNASSYLLALSFQKQDECSKAINSYETFIKKEDKFFTEKAMFNIAICSEVLNDFAKAIEMYDTINIKYPDSNYAKLSSIARSKLKEGENK